jgi:hypothetical protein
MLRAGHARPLPRSFFKLPLQAFQMPLRQTVHFLGACKAKGADGLFLGGDDRHDGALGQRTAFLTMAATAEFSVCLGMPQSAAMRFWVSGSHDVTSAYSVQNAASDRPHRCAAAWYRALHSLNWRFVLSSRARAWDSFSSIFFPLLNPISDSIIVRNRIYVKCRILMLLFVQLSHCLHPPQIL